MSKHGWMEMKDHFRLVSEILSFFIANFCCRREMGWGWNWEETGKGLGRQEISSAVQLEVPKADCSPLG